MKYLILYLLFPVLISSQDLEIKSLKAYPSSDRTAFPVLDYSDTDPSKLRIEFDIESDFEPDLVIVFRYCDSQWNPYESVFLRNTGYDTDYNLSYQPMPTTVAGADYRFSSVYPNDDVNFPFSGKYRYYITDSQDTSEVYAQGRFLVVKPEIKLRANISRERIDDKIINPANLRKTFRIEVDFSLKPAQDASRVNKIEIIENHKFNQPITVSRDEPGTNYRYYEWNAADDFTFVARNIRPQNEYRQIDIRDPVKYSKPEAYAQYKGVDVSRFYDYGGSDYNGGFILMPFRDGYADYLDIIFRLRIQEDIPGRKFVVGSFTDWKVLPKYEMTQNYSGIYEKSVELKRGVYDYQYVVGDIEDDKVVNQDWLILEGNFWTAENDYHILLYYDTPEKGGYEKVIGYVKLNSGKL
jgi:hypothetical protein